MTTPASHAAPAGSSGFRGIMKAILDRWPLFAGLLVPALFYGVGHVAPAFYDSTILNVVYRWSLPLRWLLLAIFFGLSFFRQDRRGVIRGTHLLLIGLLIGALLVYDGWYFYPFAVAGLMALALWRIRWIEWSRRRQAARDVVVVVAVAVAAMAFNLGRNNMGFDNRFGFGFSFFGNAILLAWVLGGGAFLVLVWLRRFDAASDVLNRDKLAHLISRDPRCRQFFDYARKLTRCGHPAASEPGREPARLPPCADVPAEPGASPEPPPPAPDPAATADAPADANGQTVTGPGLGMAVRKSWRQASDFFVAHGSLGTHPIYPDARPVPPLVVEGWKWAELIMGIRGAPGNLRWTRTPVRELALPSPVIREMVREGARRQHELYWTLLMEPDDGTDTLPRDPHDRKVLANWFFGRMVMLYEALIEAEDVFFLSPEEILTPADAGARLDGLKEELKKLLEGRKRKADEPPAEPPPALPAPVREGRLAAWNRVHRRYLDLWIENVDRMIMLKGLDLFSDQADLCQPVHFHQLTCNMLACRAELRRLKAPGADSVHARAADLALWLLVREASRPDLSPEAEPLADYKAMRDLFHAYFEGLTQELNRAEGVAKKGTPGAVAVPAPVFAEMTMTACAYALWQGACGNWNMAFRPVFLLGQYSGSAHALLSGADRTGAGSLSSHAMLRTAEHVRFIQALRALAGQIVPGSLDAEVPFDVTVSVESSLALYRNALARPDSDFQEWHPGRNENIISRMAGQALDRL